MGGPWDVFWGEGFPIVKRSPFASIVLVLGGIVAGFLGTSFYFNDRVSDQKELIARLRIAAGISQPTAKTSMMELTNNELKSKGSRLVARIREISDIHSQHVTNIQKQKEAEKMTDEKYKILIDQEMHRALNQFETVRVDALMVTDELRARLSPHVREKILTAKPNFSSSDDPKADVNFARLAVGFGGVALAILAEEIEELSKLQLERLETCAC
jgi:hypothetical protein